MPLGSAFNLFSLVSPRILMGQFSKNPRPFISDHHPYSPPLISYHPALPSAKNSVNLVQLEFPLLTMLPLSKFLSTEPDLAPWLSIPTCASCAQSCTSSLPYHNIPPPHAPLKQSFLGSLPLGHPRWLSGKKKKKKKKKVTCQHRRPGFEPWVRKIPLEKEMIAHSSILA